MRIHRSAHTRNFTVLPNILLQDRRLSYTARGLLADLLSRPDGWREDGRHMADSSPQGRGAIRKALKELTQAGYYRVDIVRMPDGTVRSEAHVYDTPQLGPPQVGPPQVGPPPPGVPRPASGEAATGGAGAPVVKNRDQETSHPGEPAERHGQPDHRPPDLPDEQTREAVAALFRVIRPEPRLRLGEAEARELAPLVTPWLQRGTTTAELAQALLPALPTPMHSAAGVLRYRLKHKLPPVRIPEQHPGRPRYAECADCHDPIPKPGVCAPCAGLGVSGRRPAADAGTAVVATAGAARARAALHAAKATPSTRPPARPGAGQAQRRTFLPV